MLGERVAKGVGMKYSMLALAAVAAISSTPAFATKFEMQVTAGPKQTSRMESGVGVVSTTGAPDQVRGSARISGLQR